MGQLAKQLGKTLSKKLGKSLAGLEGGGAPAPGVVWKFGEQTFGTPGLLFGAPPP